MNTVPLLSLTCTEVSPEKHILKGGAGVGDFAGATVSDGIAAGFDEAGNSTGWLTMGELGRGAVTGAATTGALVVATGNVIAPGEMVGAGGFEIGWEVSIEVGFGLPIKVGIRAGDDVGTEAGFEVGWAVSREVGFAVGWAVGKEVDFAVGCAVGIEVGCAVGKLVGFAVGTEVGFAVLVELVVGFKATQPQTPLYRFWDSKQLGLLAKTNLRVVS
jgi:hypothetical protein